VFVRELAANRVKGTVNPYAAADEVRGLDRPGAAAIRIANLLDYLRSRHHPRLLLVGEAPGYRGCRFSGIPFTSERSLPPDRWSSLHTDGWLEPSATVVHRALARMGVDAETLLWNAMPWHPVDGGPLTNRPPAASELRAGAIWLMRLLQLAQPALVVAVGRPASRILSGHPVIRHPSHGGARRFESELRAVLIDAPPSAASGRVAGKMFTSSGRPPDNGLMLVDNHVGTPTSLI
jgi:uracil-DNA glycosylase